MNYQNKKAGYYENVRHEMVALCPSNINTLLDVGCSEGNFAAHIKHAKGIEVWGIEMMEEHGEKAKNKLDKVLIGNCESQIDELPDNYFDVIYFNDVLEHLVNPGVVLNQIKQKLSRNGVLISSIPNMRYHKVLKDLIVRKDFQYTNDGVMDQTHLRWFTNKSIQRMYQDNGYEILSHHGINKTKSIKPYLYNIPLFFSAMDIFYVQFATVVKPA
ncbi:MAG: class I SAM-dependent methyltransferase [Crocinitomicaceae bacterium]